jgi:hypothetical protein
MQAHKDELDRILIAAIEGNTYAASRVVKTLMDDIDILNIKFNDETEAYLKELVSLEDLIKG